MRRLAFLSVLCLAVGLLAGCGAAIRTPVRPALGIGYAETAFPIDVTFNGQKMGQKSGSVESTTILNLVATGDSSISGAAQAGGITTVEHVDAHFFSILGVYQVYTTTVYGQ
ncbi:MAG: TRL domain-containing protein [Sumerlaeia bacterium]